MNREDYLLTTLCEECAEVIQAVSKIQRFGYDSHNPFTKLDNLSSLIGELNDIIAMTRMLVIENYIPVSWENDTHQLNKIDKVNHYESIHNTANS